MDEFEFRNLFGADIKQHFSDLARVRMKVFREWPYLYDGSIEYEREYLENYFRSERSLCVLCFHKGRVVGVSTLMPLAEEHDELKQPMHAAGYDIDRLFYYGESCMLPEFRGRGVYQKFFKRREEHVRGFGSDYDAVCFCAVVRPTLHPLRPKNYRPLDETWIKYGFAKVVGIQMSLQWRDIGESEQSRKYLDIWLKRLV